MVEVVPVVYYRVDQRHSGFSLPVIDLRDRRNAAHPPLVRWVYQKHLEIILFNSYGESGAVWKLLNQASLGRIARPLRRRVVLHSYLDGQRGRPDAVCTRTVPPRALR